MKCKNYTVVKKIDNTFGTIEWKIGVKKSWNKLRKELRSKFPKDQGYIISISID